MTICHFGNVGGCRLSLCALWPFLRGGLRAGCLPPGRICVPGTEEVEGWCHHLCSLYREVGNFSPARGEMGKVGNRIVMIELKQSRSAA